jgi:hypothetical protein
MRMYSTVTVKTCVKTRLSNAKNKTTFNSCLPLYYERRKLMHVNLRVDCFARKIKINKKTNLNKDKKKNSLTAIRTPDA